MPSANISGIKLSYQLHGPEAGRPLVLIMGLGQSLAAWPPGLIEAFAQAGFRVLIYDQRDTGRSTQMNQIPFPSVAEAYSAALAGQMAPAPYTLDAMAEDCLGLMGHLGWSRAHICGVSMGGMVAQIMAADPRKRVASLISIMSTTSERDLPPPSPAGMETLLRPAPPRIQAREAVQHGVWVRKRLMSPAYPTDEAELWARSQAGYDRGYHRSGVARHLLAVWASGDRRELLKTIAVPTLVIHGEEDPIVPIACGHRTAELIEGAEFWGIEGFAHDLPGPLHQAFAQRIWALSEKAA